MCASDLLFNSQSREGLAGLKFWYRPVLQATSLANVTGESVLIGVASAMQTLCGQVCKALCLSCRNMQGSQAEQMKDDEDRITLKRMASHINSICIAFAKIHVHVVLTANAKVAASL